MSDIAHVVQQLDSSHLDVLRHTLPTPSFKLVLDLLHSDYEKQQSELDISVAENEFKRNYIALDARKEFVKEFSEFVINLTKQTDEANHDSTM